MQFFSSLLAQGLCLASAVVAGPQRNPDYNCGQMPLSHHITCAPPAKSVVLLRAWSLDLRDHFYTTNATEMNHATTALGYHSELAPGNLFSSAYAGTVPLYRAFNYDISDHFYTTNKTEMENAYKIGYAPEGITGYLYPQQICDSIPLFRAYRASYHDHFYTSDEAERDHAVGSLGYQDEGIAGYILPL